MASPDPAATEAERGRGSARKEDASAATMTAAAAAAAGFVMPDGRRFQGSAPIMRRPSPAARRDGQARVWAGGRGRRRISRRAAGIIESRRGDGRALESAGFSSLTGRIVR